MGWGTLCDGNWQNLLSQSGFSKFNRFVLFCLSIWISHNCFWFVLSNFGLFLLTGSCAWLMRPSKTVKFTKIIAERAIKSIEISFKRGECTMVWSLSWVPSVEKITQSSFLPKIIDLFVLSYTTRSWQHCHLCIISNVKRDSKVYKMSFK